jgi:4-aminobutyrate aminotransferase/(S)-3-amino-2-methylpropionate transaminase
MASGMPISACLGRAEIMDAWPPSHGEAIHTQTFLGHPPGCAAALAAIAVIEEEKLVEQAAKSGAVALARLREHLHGRGWIADVRGRGLALAVECDSPERAGDACGKALAKGVIALLSGDDDRVLSLTPPLCIEREILELALDHIAEALA